MIRRRLAWWLGGVLSVALSAASASAGDKLTVQGVVLSPVKVAPASAAISRTIDLEAGEQVAHTYVSLRTADGKYLQRNNDGYWLPWNGTRDTLLDNKFQAVGSTLTFKVLKQDISQQPFPLTVSITYESSAGLKFGVFEVLPQ